MTPKDFEIYEGFAGPGVQLGSWIVGGYSRTAWKMPESEKGNQWVVTSVPIPAEWKAATGVTMTVYYSSTAADGKIYGAGTISTLSDGDVLGATGMYPETLSVTPTGANKLIVKSFSPWAITSLGDMLDVGFLRVNFDESDPNTGDVYFYGMRLTPIF